MDEQQVYKALTERVGAPESVLLPKIWRLLVTPHEGRMLLELGILHSRFTLIGPCAGLTRWQQAPKARSQGQADQAERIGLFMPNQLHHTGNASCSPIC